VFGQQAMRLLRTKWKQVNTFAQELYAMFQDDIPLEHSAPITINYAGPDAPLKLDRGFSDGPVITASSGGKDGGMKFTPDGSTTIYGDQVVFEYLENGEVVRTPVQDLGNKAQDDKKPSASTYPAQVVSGEAQTYIVTLYTNGVGSTGTKVTATALGVADDATLDVDSWHMVSAISTVVAGQSKTAYYFTPNVWGAD